MAKSNTFLCQVYEDESERKLYELVEYLDEDFLKFKVMFKDINGLQEILHNEEKTKDFGEKNGLLLWGGPEAMEVGSEFIDRYVGNESVVEVTHKHIYEVLKSLAENKARFLGTKEDVVDFIKENGTLPEFGTVSMSTLKISRTTMRIYLSVLTENGWRTETIIGNEDGLYLNPFHFMLDSKLKQLMEGVAGIVELFEVEMGGDVFTVYKLTDGMSLYTQFSNFRLAIPWINEKFVESERDRVCANFLNYFVELVNSQLFGVKETEKTDESRVYVQTDKRGVFMRLEQKLFRSDERFALVNLAINEMDKLKKGETSVKEIMAYVRGQGYDQFKSNAFIVLMTALLSSKGGLLEKRDAAMDVRNSVQLKSLSTELELFALRAAIFVSDFKFPDYEDQVQLSGGKSGLTTLMYKVR